MGAVSKAKPMKHRLANGHLAIAALGASLALVSGCTVPKMLQEPFEQGVYEDILERQAQGVPVEDEKLKNLPAMTAADYDRLGDTYMSRGQYGLARAKYEKALELHPADWGRGGGGGAGRRRRSAAAEAAPGGQ